MAYLTKGHGRFSCNLIMMSSSTVQALKVYVPSYESYGRMWPHMQARILASLVLYQLTMFGYFGAKKFPYTVILIPVIVFSLVFAYVCKRKFYRFFQDTALEVAAEELKETPDMEQIFRSYIPPSLRNQKIDDDQFEDALSQVSRRASLV
ncbi:hypothetical protein SAY86_006222 [Trapa natans]|uniref:CSC1/OSCA1-like 7TM region domain-containing protein n=1 Tax=Trapa natans TaxID=22666 RepID=A0AAN7L6X2_TRANT|nr:hypothetical protein SAY86_006222 [Trapa natans]